MTDTNKLAIITRALTWLEANPDKHIVGDFATTADPDSGERFKVVPPTDPEAKCFCILGRIANEAGIIQTDPDYPDEISEAPFGATEQFISEALGRKVESFEIYIINDNLRKNNQAVILNALRQFLSPTT